MRRNRQLPAMLYGPENISGGARNVAARCMRDINEDISNINPYIY